MNGRARGVYYQRNRFNTCHNEIATRSSSATMYIVCYVVSVRGACTETTHHYRLHWTLGEASGNQCPFSAEPYQGVLSPVGFTCADGVATENADGKSVVIVGVQRVERKRMSPNYSLSPPLSLPLSHSNDIKAPYVINHKCLPTLTHLIRVHGFNSFRRPPDANLSFSCISIRRVWAVFPPS